jgi:hypothetical protein
MSTASHPPRLRTIIIRANMERAVFEPRTLDVALRDALSEMLGGANLIASAQQVEGPLFIVPDLSSRELVLKESIGHTATAGSVVAPYLTADQLPLALRSKNPIDVSSAWTKRQIPIWARELRDATSLHAASALIADDVRSVLSEATAPSSDHRVPIGAWLSRCRAGRDMREQKLPYLIGYMGAEGNEARLPRFSLEMVPPYRIPKKGEFLTLNLATFTKMAPVGPASSDAEIVRKVSFAAAAAFLAARYGARVAAEIQYNDPPEWGRPMESFLDVLAFTVGTSGMADDPSLGDQASSPSHLIVVADTDAGTMRLASVGSAHGRLVLRRGINQPTIVRDPGDFIPYERDEEIGSAVLLAILDALVENEERLAVETPQGWRARALEQALGRLAFRRAPEGGFRGDLQGLRLLREHCRRTGKNIDDIIPRRALPDAIQRVQAHGLDFPPELCEAADRRARLPAEHPDRLWMITERRTVTGVAWSAVIGPELRVFPIAWLRGTLMLDNLIN